MSTTADATESKDPKVDVVDDDEEEDSDDDMPGLEGAQDDKAGGKQSRTEKKARRAMHKMGMKVVPGITRVTVKKAKNILFVIGTPEVFKSPTSDTYIVFGEAKIEDMSSQAQARAATQFQEADLSALTKSIGKTAGSAAAAPEDDGPEQDATGLNPDEIALVMEHGASRNKAISLLRKHGQVVEAIMNLN